MRRLSEMRSKYSGEEIEISRNYEPGEDDNYKSGGAEAVFIDLRGQGDVAVTTTEAREIAAALIEAADEFDKLFQEAARARLPTQTGAVVYWNQSDTKGTRLASRTGSWGMRWHYQKPGENGTREYTDEQLMREIGSYKFEIALPKEEQND